MSVLNILGRPAVDSKLSAHAPVSSNSEGGFAKVLGQTAKNEKSLTKRDEIRSKTEKSVTPNPRPQPNMLSSGKVKSSRDSVTFGQPDAESEVPRETVEATGVEESGLAPGGLPMASGPNLADRVGAMPTPPPPMTAPVSVRGRTLAAPTEESTDALTRRVVWNDFLRKMSNELGVSAEDILKAFQSLTAEELQAPPEQSLDQVVAALGLNDNQSVVARQHFQELLAKTKPKSLGQEISATQKQLNLIQLSQRDWHQKTMAKSLDQMNQNFFMNQPQVVGAQGQVAANQLPGQQAEVSDRNSAGAYSAASTSAANSAGWAAGGQRAAIGFPSAGLPTTPGLASPVPAAGSLPAASSTPSEQLASASSTTDLSAAGQFAKSPFAQQLNLQNSIEAPVGKVGGAAGGGAMAATALAGAASAATGLSVGPIFGGGGFESESENETEAGLESLGNQFVTDGRLQSQASPTEFQNQLQSANGPSVTSQPMGLNQVLEKAQFMATDGGGEMKVTLTPEGLGQVAMKVSVNEGKVSVQMITESDEAKRMIERQLGDLKTQLNANQLNVDSIKIDTSSNLGKQLEQQYQDAHRQAAQQSMEQFRQDHQGWRRSFFDMPSARYARTQSEGTRDIPAPGVSSSSKSRGAKRLDLVA